MHRRRLLKAKEDEKRPISAVSRNSSSPSSVERKPYKRPSQTGAKTAFITRSNNPNKNPDLKPDKPENKPEEKKSQELPKYLALIWHVLYYPVNFVYKIYLSVRYVIDLQRRIYEKILYLATLPGIWLEKFVLVCKEAPVKTVVWIARNLEGLIEICALYRLGGLTGIAILFWLFPVQTMTYPLFALLRLVLGTLYPAYASYKAVRTKNVREYVKWMMYWIVFAIFASVETFADIFVAFWFPFYYEVKILFLIWLISPVSRGSLGSSILYRRFVHPCLVGREEEIDRWIGRLQEQGYNTVSRLAVRGFNYVSNMVMQTAIRGGGGLVHQLRKSYSLTDLGHDEADFGAKESRAITSDQDDIAELELRRRTGSATRSGPVRYVRHIPNDPDHIVPRRRSSRSRDSIRQRDTDEMSSSGYSSTVNAEYYPVNTETMDTEDYELYDPRIHSRPRLIQNRGQPSSSRKLKEVSHYGTLPRSYSRQTRTTRPGILPNRDSFDK